MKHSLIPATLLALAVALASAACGTTYLPNTEIESTEETRAIYDVVMQYKRAMEDRDPDAILQLVSRNYFENSATTDKRDDDYGYEKLREEVLPKLRQNVKNVQYRMILSRIEVDGDRAWATYEYWYIFKYVEGGSEGLHQDNNYNKLEFVLENGQWKIASGL